MNHQGWIPDRILAHSGWGESIAIREVWPNTPQIIWPELWVLPLHGGHGIDPSLPPSNLISQLEQVGRNSMTRVALDHAHSWVLPTLHQANSLPAEFQNNRLHVIHEGIDSTVATPKPDIKFELRGSIFDRSVPVVTFVNRNLERLRGFDMFMRSIPLIQQNHPDTRFIIVGDSERVMVPTIPLEDHYGKL